MAAGDLLIGLDGKFLYGTAGSQADTEATNVDDVTGKITDDFATISRRGKRFKDNKPTAGDVEISLKLYKVAGDAFRATLIAAKLAKTPLAIYATEEDSGEGFDGDFYVGDMQDAQGNADAQAWDVTFKATQEQREVTWQ